MRRSTSRWSTAASPPAAAARSKARRTCAESSPNACALIWSGQWVCNTLYKAVVYNSAPAKFRQSTGATAMVVAIVLVLLVVGSVLFHFLSPWYFTPIASNWSAMDDTISITFWVTGFVFVAINLFMAYAVIRYRYRKGKRAQYEPENKKLEWWLTGVTTVGVAAMLAPGLFVWAKFVEVPANAAVFEAVGKQWNWGFRFPGKDGVMGTVDAKYVSDKNPFGMNPDDPNGQDDVLVSSPELHLPVGRPVKALLRSIDVLHNFAVPQFRAKMDLVPGLVTYIWFTPTRTGKFDLLCNELCGTGHFVMRGSVVVEEESTFQAWLSSIRRSRKPQLKPPAMLPRAGRSMQCVLPVMACKRRGIPR